MDKPRSAPKQTPFVREVECAINVWLSAMEDTRSQFCALQITRLDILTLAEEILRCLEENPA